MKAFIATLLIGWAVSAAAGVKPTATPPTVDGRIDEVVWGEADWETGFRKFRNATHGREVKADTSFAVLADAENLYVAVKCSEPDMKGTEAAAPAGIFSKFNNSVELVFAPDGLAFDYYQFVVTFRGDTYAMFYSENGNIRPDPYGADWEAKVGRFEDGWTVEMRVPLAAFYMTREANWRTDWKVNVSRTRSLEGFSSWCDLEKGFKEPRNFRTLGGFPRRRLAEDVWVKSVQPEVVGRKDGKIVGRMTFGFLVAQGGEFTLETPFTGTRKMTLAAGNSEQTVEAVFPENGRHTIPVTLVRTGDSVKFVRTYPVLVDYEAIRVKLTAPRVLRTLGVAALKEPVWVDLMTGGVYEFPSENVIVNSEGVTYLDVPVYDSPCLLAEKSALEIE